VLDKDEVGGQVTYNRVDTFDFDYTTEASWPSEELVLTGNRALLFKTTRLDSLNTIFCSQYTSTGVLHHTIANSFARLSNQPLLYS